MRAKGIGEAQLRRTASRPRDVVRRKLKNDLKIQKMHFLPIFELTSDSLTTLCLLHQAIILIKGSMKFLRKILRTGGVGKWAFFSQPFWIFFCNKQFFCLCFSNENYLGFHMRYNFSQNFDDYKTKQPKQPFYTILHTIVPSGFELYCFRTISILNLNKLS